MTTHKYIHRLPDTVHKQGGVRVQIRHEDVILWSLNHDQRFNSATRAARRAGDRIEDEIANMAEQGYAKLTVEDHALLNQALQQPAPLQGADAYPVYRGAAPDGTPIVVSLAKAAGQYVDGVADAKDAPPEKPVEKQNGAGDETAAEAQA